MNSGTDTSRQEYTIVAFCVTLAGTVVEMHLVYFLRTTFGLREQLHGRGDTNFLNAQVYSTICMSHGKVHRWRKSVQCVRCWLHESVLCLQ